MIEEKIMELYNFGFNIDKISSDIQKLYNKNLFHIINFNKISIFEARRLVANVLLKHIQ